MNQRFFQDFQPSPANVTCFLRDMMADENRAAMTLTKDDSPMMQFDLIGFHQGI